MSKYSIASEGSAAGVQNGRRSRFTQGAQRSVSARLPATAGRLPSSSVKRIRLPLSLFLRIQFSS